MSQKARTSIIILVFLIFATFGMSGFFIYQNTELQKTNQTLQTQISGLQKDFSSARKDKDQLEGNLRKMTLEVSSLNTEKENLGRQIKMLREKKISVETELNQKQVENENLQTQLSAIRSDLDNANEKMEKTRRERDDLARTLKDRRQQEMAKVNEQSKGSDRFEQGSADLREADAGDDEYWANILKQKAELEIRLEKLQEKISNVSLEIVDLKDENAKLQIELDSVKTQKNELETQLVTKEQMIDVISVELARTKREKKELMYRIDGLTETNSGLREDIKKLVSAKSSLEKSVVSLSNDKQKMEDKLGETESIIQSKIDEIWTIKESLDKTIRQAGIEQQTKPSTDAVELPPIVVRSAQPDEIQYASGPNVTSPGFQGQVVSVNDENNFVIVDIGEVKGARVGDQLSVYHAGAQVANLEIIQVRQDISAADIRSKNGSIAVGDIVR